MIARDIGRITLGGVRAMGNGSPSIATAVRSLRSSLVSNSAIQAALVIAVSGVLAGGYASLGDATAGGIIPPDLARLAGVAVGLVPPLIALSLILVVGHRLWWSGFVAFFAWLPFEDLARKFSGNDLRLYFVKYALFGAALVLAVGHLRPYIRPAFGRLTRPTLLVLTFAFVYAVPSAFIGGFRIPIIGIVVRFFFIALVPLGFYLALDRDRFRRVLMGLGVMSSGICAVGIAQAIIGPEFLNPSFEIATLPHLVVLRSGGQVIQPAGPFVDVARFASMTTITVLLGVVLLRIAVTRNHRFAGGVFMATGVAASFASAGRASFVFSMVIAASGVLFVGRRAATGRVAVLVAAGLVVAVVLATSGGVVGDLASGRTEFLSSTLSPFGEQSEIVPRSKYYGRNLVAGIRNGNYVGLGTGNQSIGTQYFDVEDRVGTLSESGWGQIAVEWGVLGLAAWVFWVACWLSRAIAIARSASSSSSGIADAVAPIVLWMVLILGVYFGFGGNFFDNYITNIFFWLLSGAVFASEKATVPLEHAKLVASPA